MRRWVVRMAGVAALAGILCVSASFASQSGWYVGGSTGVGFNQTQRNMQVANGIPNSFDTYRRFSVSDSFLAGVQAGYQFATHWSWLSAISAGLVYQYSSPSLTKGVVRLFSLPAFANYHYAYRVLSQNLLFQLTFNLIQWHHVVPYVAALAGVAFNRLSGYRELPLSGILPRVSPAFGNHTECAFAYGASIGLAMRASQYVRVDLAYRFVNLGRVESARGQGLWNAERLRNRLYSNQVLLSINAFLH